MQHDSNLPTRERKFFKAAPLECNASNNSNNDL